MRVISPALAIALITASLLVSSTPASATTAIAPRTVSHGTYRDPMTRPTLIPNCVSL